MARAVWTVRLAAAAETDFRHILRWTVEHFGAAQARVYSGTLSCALGALGAGPGIAGVKQRPDIGATIRTLHAARKGRKGRHFVMFRVHHLPQQDVIEVLRLLHDSMDLQRHMPPSAAATPGGQ